MAELLKPLFFGLNALELYGIIHIIGWAIFIMVYVRINYYDSADYRKHPIKLWFDAVALGAIWPIYLMALFFMIGAQGMFL